MTPRLCARCGRRIILGGGPASRAGVESGCTLANGRGWHPSCVPRRGRENTTGEPRSERYILRLTLAERKELDRLQDLTGSASVAELLRGLWQRELGTFAAAEKQAARRNRP